MYMYKKEIEAYIESHREEMLADICTLCRINSEKMPYSEGKPFGEGVFTALQTALSMAEQYGFSITNYDSYVGTADLNGKERQLDILAHLDVVPAGEGWTVTEPFEPVIKDGRIYGRGTADDKGPAVAALYAMRAVKELKIPMKKNVRLILGTDEECGSSDIAVYYDREPEAPMTFSPDAAFPVTNVEKGRLEGHFTMSMPEGESSSPLKELKAGTKANVVPGKATAVVEGIDRTLLESVAETAEKETGVAFRLIPEGETGIRITAEGQGAHASTPEVGVNALTALIEYLNRLPLGENPQAEALRALGRLFPHGDTCGRALGVEMRDEVSGALTMAFDLLEVTEKGVEGVFDSRCPICGNEKNVLEVIRERMAQEGFTLLNDSMIPPHHVDESSVFVQTLLRVYEEYTGKKGSCEATGGGTYVHHLKNGVAFGASMPGTDNRMHGADEFAVVEELMLSARIFAQVIVELCANFDE